MKTDRGASDESISALVDGQLPADELAQTLDGLGAGARQKQTWYTYQVIGDVLRSAELAPRGNDLAFLAKLEQRLALEPQPTKVIAAEPVQAIAARVVTAQPASANAALWRWRGVAAVLCTALAGVIGLGQWSDAGPKRQLARLNPLVTPVVSTRIVDANAQIMIRDPALDSLLEAHQQLGGHSALQRPNGFLRNATYEGSAR